MVARYSSAAKNLLFLPRPMIGGTPFITFLIDKNRPFVPGSMMATWRRFTIILRYRLSGIGLFFKIIWISETMYLALILGILTVLALPSTRKPNISFYVLRCAPPFCSFFKYIGTFPPVSPVTSGGEKCCESHARLPC